MNNKWRRSILSTSLAAGMAATALDVRLQTVQYEVATSKVESPIRVVLLTDLHNNTYGENQQRLIKAIDRIKPQVVLLGGDIFERSTTWQPVTDLVQWITTYYPVFFVTGNHEFHSGEQEEMKQFMHDFGVKVLDGRTEFLTDGHTKLAVSGIDDAGHSDYNMQLVRANASRPAEDENVFNILLTHRPEYIKDYLPYGYDLILSGHAHGGQWRIPKLMNGFFAPGQGLLPQYAGGRYDLGDTTFIVSRGLSYQKQIVPRLFNRPELVVIDIVHKTDPVEMKDVGMKS